MPAKSKALFIPEEKLPHFSQPHPNFFLFLGRKIKFQEEKSLGPCFAYTILAFNRILDFSNGLDIYLGFFYVRLLIGEMALITFATCTNDCYLDCC